MTANMSIYRRIEAPMNISPRGISWESTNGGSLRGYEEGAATVTESFDCELTSFGLSVSMTALDLFINHNLGISIIITSIPLLHHGSSSKS